MVKFCARYIDLGQLSGVMDVHLGVAGIALGH